MKKLRHNFVNRRQCHNFVDQLPSTLRSTCLLRPKLCMHLLLTTVSSSRINEDTHHGEPSANCGFPFPAMHQKKRPLDRENLNSSREGSESPLRMHDTAGLANDGRDSPKMSREGRESVANKYAKINSFPSAMDTDSPASYPKHVIVPSPPDSNDQRQQPLGQRTSGDYMDDSPHMKKSNDQVVTPILSHEARYHGHGGYNVPTYRPQGGYYPQRGGDGYGYGYYQNHGEMDAYPQYGHGHKAQPHPKRWACDYCRVATFPTYEDACAHEEGCAARYGVHHRQRPYPANAPHDYTNRQQAGGLGTLYQATQEVRHYSPRMPPPPHHESYHHHTPPPPAHRYPPTGWGSAPPSMPSERMGHPNLSPRFREYPMYDDHHDMRHHPDAYPYHQRRMLLALPGDPDSLSDRQCFVRSKFVEVFAATEKDVAARHSKGAQKLRMGQVGIRCVHCAHVRAKDRAERAICYPSSISRIYQTVADMQRFHFEHCREIPDETRKIYKALKTTRPRGVGSPQAYWVQSARLLDLVDSEEGIFFGNGNKQRDAM